MTDVSSSWNADLSWSTFLSAKPAAMQVKIDHRDPELQE